MLNSLNRGVDLETSNTVYPPIYFFFFETILRKKSVSFVASAGVPPHKANFIEDLVVMLPQNIWDNLYSRYVLCCN